jgi:hypothetical protein
MSVGDGIVHQIQNASTQPHRQVVVEFKVSKDEAASGDNGRKR